MDRALFVASGARFVTDGEPGGGVPCTGDGIWTGKGGFGELKHGCSEIEQGTDRLKNSSL